MSAIAGHIDRVTVDSSHVDVLCDHCGLSVPRGLVEEGAAHQFCCHGCRTAYEIISSCDLQRYYDLRDADPSGNTRSKGTGARYAEFDDATFGDLYVRELPGSTRAVELFVEGVHCAACVWLVERLPRVVPGVVEARLEMRRAMVTLTWDPRRVTLSKIARTLDRLGYPPHIARDRNQRESRRIEDRAALIRIGIAGACAGNVMLLALALYAGLFDRIEPEYLLLFRWTSMLISAVSVLWPGSVFIRGAIAALRARVIQLDVPIALGLVAGLIWSVVSTFRGIGEVYFDSLSVLVFALLVGRFVQQRQQRWASDSLEMLYALTPSSARIWENGTTRDVPIEAIKRGDAVQVLAGECIPVDGVILKGETTVDQALLTGESMPIRVICGQEVAAGALNVSSEILVRVGATGEGTRVGKLMRLVEDAAQRRAPIVRLADAIAGRFVLAMICLATITVLLWWPTDPGKAIEHAAALLIVTCPCALGLATPLAVSVAIGRAARRGMLLKGGESLQALDRRGILLLDKTGTITEGRMRLLAWHGDASAKQLVSAIECSSSHPIARAIVDGIGNSEQTVAEAVVFVSSGASGTVSGHRVIVGSARHVRAGGVAEEPWIAEIERASTEDGHTPVLIAVDGKVVAVAVIGDAIRADASAAIEGLRSLGWRLGILSGDHPGAVAAVGRKLGIDPQHIYGGCDPEHKQRIVEQLSGHEPVVMVGDGVNDAAALASATVGIAVHGGAEASLSAADVYLGSPGLMPILDLLGASRRTMKVIRRNLFFSLSYNIFAAALAMTGILNPLIAAILMPASSLTVLASSLRVRTFGD
ncbi:MAG: heavy metal translocating P-type ATPase [Phycisphaeraceae bacterium]|nr:heavy metal translocating P-type ATPase [Phycisphaeraceae bacterium]